MTKIIDKYPTQYYCCVMIPETVDIDGVWEVLPPGIHEVTLEEIEDRFATTEARRKLFDGFKRGVQALRAAGCRIVYLDGSYVTTKTTPGDFDACWEPSGVDPGKLDPVLLDFSHKRRNQKQKYGGEFFPSSVRADGRKMFIELFQTDRHTGKAKGIIQITLA